MGLVRTVLKRPVSTLLMILAIAVFGLASVFGFRMEQMPDVEMPVLMVMTVYPGADPESVEELVSTEIEGSVQSLSGIKNVVSYSYENYSVMILQYDYGTDVDASYLDLRAKLDSVTADLPEDAQNPIVIEMNMNALPVLTFTVEANDDTNVLAWLDEGLLDELEALSSVAQVDVSGGTEDYIRVLLKEDMLAQYGLNINSVANYIAATDFTIPLGSLEQGSQSINASSSVANHTVEELRRIPLSTMTGAHVTLADVAEVSWGVKDAETISRYNGEPTITLQVTKNQSSGTVDVSNDVRRVLEKYDVANENISFEIISDSADTVKSSLGSVASTLVLGVILSMVVLFVFFGDFRASLIVGSSMPISLLITLILMNFLGFSLNVITLGALVIAIGMMVDSSIVVLESCFRMRKSKPDLKEAILEGTRVVMSSIVASTTTTIVVYLPLATMGGMAGQMFSQLGFTIVFAMCSSLLAAIVFVPLFFSIFRPEEKTDLPVNRLLGRVTAWYDRVIRKIMHRKKTAVLTAVVLLLMAFFMASQAGMELMEETDEGTLSVTATFRSGTRLEDVDQRIVALEELVAGYEDVESYSLTAGSSNTQNPNMMSGGTTASIAVTLRDDRKLSTDQVRESLLLATKDLLGMEVEIEKTSAAAMGPEMAATDGGEINLEGYDKEELRSFAGEVLEQARAIPGAISVSSSVDTASTKINIIVDPLMADHYGLTPIQVAGTLYTMVSGTEAMTITENGTEYSVFLEFPKGTYTTAAGLMGASIPSPTGVSVPVSEIATLEYTDAQDVVSKENGKYTATISVNCLSDDKAAVQRALEELVYTIGLPESVEMTDDAMTEMMNEEFASLFQAIATAVFLIFLVMAIQFESPKYSLMVMLSIPFSLIGSFFLLFVTGSSLSMTSLMGVLMLVGIVVNNGIIYVDTVNLLVREEGYALEDALAESGSIRLRPILMTTLTTVLSMVPMALGIGSGTEMMQGMSYIIIGGLITSTVLILMLLPSFYLIFNGGKQRAETLVTG